MTSEEYKKAVDFWKAKECKEMLSDQLKLENIAITRAVSGFLPRAERSLLDLRRTRMSVLLSLKKSIF